MFIRQYMPVLISAIIFSIADMADALVVGNRMGTLGLAAIAFSVPVYMFFNVIMHSFGLGGSIEFAKSMAKGKEDEAIRCFHGVFAVLMGISLLIAILGNIFIDGILVILGVSPSMPQLFEASKTYLQLVITAAPFFFFDYAMGYYLRNDDMEKEASLCAGIGNILDFSLNVILVLFLNMGVFGAGFATFTGVAVSSIMEFIFMCQKRSHLELLPLKPDFSKVLTSYRTGLASCISYIYSFIFIWLGNNAIIRLAGEMGVAVFDIVQNISNLMLYIFNAVAMASQPIISTYEGECNYEECDRVQLLSIRTVSISAAVLTLLTALFAPFICKLFGVYDRAAVTYGSYALRVFCICMLFAGLNLIISNYFTARNIVFPAFLISTLRGIAIIIPVAFVCIFLGKDAFWFVYPVTEISTFIILIFYLRFFYQNSSKVRKDKPSRIEDDRIYKVTLGSDISKLGPAVEEIEAFCEKWEASMKQQYYVQMTVEEMCSAIIQNGFATGDPGQNWEIDLTLVAMEDHEFSLHIRDNATSFNPFEMNKKSLDDMEDSDSDFNALGMDVIKQKAKDFYYRRYQGFNTMVVMI
jgi:Na+-driven multidrug efflux pump/anti-sigma regulatory factor (Ser/Thr protein kinase)